MSRLKKNGVFILFILVLTFPWSSYSQKKSEFPESLFGVPLGGIFNLGTSDNSKDVGTFPVKEFKDIKQFLGSGFSLYFKPLKDYKGFKYIEKPKTPIDKFFTTSFRLYILPVFPNDALTSENIRMDALRWEVVLVEWSEDAVEENHAYSWAMDFCKTLQIDLLKKPEIIDNYKLKWYNCVFEENDKEMSVISFGKRKFFQLTYTKSIYEKKNEAVDIMYRKLRMNAIRPY